MSELGKNDLFFDIAIIGAGIAGAALARELAKYELSVVVLEAKSDVCFGATKGTHGIVHCGLPGELTPLKNRGELVGNLMMEQLCREVDVPFRRIGKLLVAFNEKEINILSNIELQAKRNGVQGAELIADKKRIRQMEPCLTDEIKAVLHTPTTAIVSPWALVIGLMENAMNNGVKLFTNAKVMDINIAQQKFFINTLNGMIRAHFIINAAGVCADKVAAMVGDKSFSMSVVKMQRVVLDKQCSNLVNHIVRTLNGENPSGDFVCPTIYGDILAGMTSEIVRNKKDTKTTKKGIDEWVVPHFRRLFPILTSSSIIKPFSGSIPLAGADYHIKVANGRKRFINFVLGGSGLTAAPAMAKYVIEEVLPKAGLHLVKKESFNPHRRDIIHVTELNNEEKAKLIAKDPRYGHIICRCETVSEAEIVEAISRGASTIDGIKFRTRAGMGRCQGGFCSPRVIEILSRELGVSAREITRKGKCSEEIKYATKELLKNTSNNNGDKEI